MNRASKKIFYFFLWTIKIITITILKGTKLYIIKSKINLINYTLADKNYVAFRELNIPPININD